MYALPFIASGLCSPVKRLMTVEYDDGERLRRIGTRIGYGQRTVLETPNGL